MKAPAISMQFVRDSENWEYGYCTVELFLKLFVLPKIGQHSEEAKRLWDGYQMGEIARQFTEDNVVTFTHQQSLLFLQVTDQISKLFVTGSETFRENIFTIVQKHTNKFKDARSFEAYYLLFAIHNLREIKDLFSVEPEALELFEQLFKNSYSFKAPTK